jgi:hypothetical protein
LALLWAGMQMWPRNPCVTRRDGFAHAGQIACFWLGAGEAGERCRLSTHRLGIMRNGRACWWGGGIPLFGARGPLCRRGRWRAGVQWGGYSPTGPGSAVLLRVRWSRYSLMSRRR